MFSFEATQMFYCRLGEGGKVLSSVQFSSFLLFFSPVVGWYFVFLLRFLVFFFMSSHFCNLCVLLLVERLVLGVGVSGVGIPVVIRLVVAHVWSDRGGRAGLRV